MILTQATDEAQWVTAFVTTPVDWSPVPTTHIAKREKRLLEVVL